MSKLINPEYKPHAELNISDADWDAYKAEVKTYLQTNASKAAIEEADLRAINSDFSNDTLWAQLASDMELVALGTG